MQLWFIPLIFAILLGNLDVYESGSERLLGFFEEDYADAFCQRQIAYAANWEAGAAYLAARYELRARPEEAPEPSDLCEGRVFELYRESNSRLAPDYPNWWARRNRKR